VGKPTVPSMLLDGRPVPVIHPVQVAGIIGMADPSGGPEPWLPLAWDVAAILDDWVRLLPSYSEEALLAPTLSRGRNSRNLTVNVCRPIALLPTAFREGFFAWYTGEADLQVEAYLRSVEEVTAYARAASDAWQGWLLEVSEEEGLPDPFVTSTRGDTSFSDLVRSQRFHAAFHHRQITDFLVTEGVAVERQLDVAAMGGIGLPEALY
jgi:hypothetical protein